MDDLSFISSTSSTSRFSTSSKQQQEQEQEQEQGRQHRRQRQNARSPLLIDFHSEQSGGRSAITELATALRQLHIENSHSPEEVSKKPLITARDTIRGLPFCNRPMPSPRPFGPLAFLSEKHKMDAIEPRIGVCGDIVAGGRKSSLHVERRPSSKLELGAPLAEASEIKALLEIPMAKLLEGKYSLLLSIPDTEDGDATTVEAGEANPYRAGCDSSTDRRRRIFGCNVVTCRRRPFLGQGHSCPRLAANIVTVVATPLPEHEEAVLKACGVSTGTKGSEDASMNQVIPGSLKVMAPVVEHLKPMQPPRPQITPVRIPSLPPSQQMSLSRVIASPGSDYSANSTCRGSRRASSECHHSPRIEDVLEFIDQEADCVEEFVQEFTGVLGAASHNAKSNHTDKLQPARTPKRHTPSVRCTTSSKTTHKSTTPQLVIDPSKATAAKQANRRPIATVPLPNHRDAGQRVGGDERNESSEEHSPSRQDLQKKVIPRPLSLQPPRPLTKSTKAPTIPSFELPGKAVARRLKEQREARLAQQQRSQRKPTITVSRPQPKQTKAPTHPGSNTRGGDILRRKEEREVKLRQEGKERPGKAEPKAHLVRFERCTEISRSQCTIAGRVHRLDVASENSPKRPEPPAHKSTIDTLRSRQPLTAAAVVNIAPQSVRGRESDISTIIQGARATSTSTVAGSSSHGFSADERLAQEIRSKKKMVKRESLYFGEQERIKLAREQVTKGAREEAAERSRNLGREWAEKQQRKLATKKVKPAAALTGA